MTLGAILVLRNTFVWKIDTHPLCRKASIIELYTFIMFFQEIWHSHCIT